MYEVEFMGDVWSFHLPRPSAAVLLAGMAGTGEEERLGGLMGFLEQVLSLSSLDRLLERAMTSGDPLEVEHVAELIELIVQEHSARPFHVCVTLSATAVQQWPQVRGRLVLAGVADPLRELPSLWALLDAVESLILEGMQKEEDQKKYYSRVYTPPIGTLSRSSAPPPGWAAEDEMAAFVDVD